MSGRPKDPFSTLGDDEFPPADDARQGKPGRDDEYRSLREEDFDQMSAPPERSPVPTPPPRSDRKPIPTPARPKPPAKPPDQYTRVGEPPADIAHPTPKVVNPTPRNVGETLAPEDEVSPPKPGRRPSLVTPSPGKHRLDESSVSKSILRTGKGGVAPQNGDDLAALLLDAEVVTSEDWEAALDAVENNLANVPAILKQLNQQKASWTDDFPEHFTALTDYQVREIWAGRGLGLRAYGEFVILDVIGEGGMGKVYKARGLGPYNLPKIYAIKTIRTDHDADQTIRGTPSSNTVGRFRQEAQVLAKLEHNNLPRIYASDMSMDGVPFIVMDFLKGPTLEQIVKEKTECHERIDWKWATAVILDIADVLQHAHTHQDAAGNPRPVIHRDIKPANVIMKDGKVPMLVDLGIAKFATSQRAGQTSTSETAARGGPLGTPAYMPFEQWAEASNVTPASDIYSLAGTWYNLLTGELPFPAEDSQSLMYQVMTADRPKITDHRKDVPREFDDILAKAMAIKPEERFASAQEFIDALRPFVDDAKGLSGVQKLSLAGAVLALAAAIAFAVIHINPGQGPNPELVAAQQKAPEFFDKARKSGLEEDWKEARAWYNKLAGFGAEAGNLGEANLRQAIASIPLGDYDAALKCLRDASALGIAPDQMREAGLFEILLRRIPESPAAGDGSAQVRALLAEAEKHAAGDDKNQMLLRLANLVAASGSKEEALQSFRGLISAGGAVAEKAKAAAKPIFAELLAGTAGALTGDQLVRAYTEASGYSLIDSSFKLDRVAAAYAERWDPNTLLRGTESGWKQAQGELQQALRLDSGNQSALLRYAMVCVLLKQDEEAEKYFAQVKRSNDVVRARVELAKQLKAEEDRAFKLAQRANQENSALPESERIDDAEKIYNSILAERTAREKGKIPDDLVRAAGFPPDRRQQAIREWARKLIEAGQFDTVYSVYEAPKLPPEIKSELRMDAAAASAADARRLEKENSSRALVLAETAAKIDPQNLEAYRVWRDLIVANTANPDRFAQATNRLDVARAAKARGLTPEIEREWAPLFLQYGINLLKSADNRAEAILARDKLTAAIELDGANPEAHYFRALAHLKLVPLGDAVSELKRAAADFETASKLPNLNPELAKRLKPETADCLSQLAMTLIDRGDLAEAMLAGNKALAYSDNNPQIRGKLIEKFVEFAKPRAGDRERLTQAAEALKAVRLINPSPAVDGWIRLTEIAGADPDKLEVDVPGIRSLLSRIDDADARRELEREFGRALTDAGVRVVKPDQLPTVLKAMSLYEAASEIDAKAGDAERRDKVESVLGHMFTLAKRMSTNADGLLDSDPERARKGIREAIELAGKVESKEKRTDDLQRVRKLIADCHLNLAYMASKSSNFDDALKECKQAEKAYPDYYFTQFYLAGAYLELFRADVQKLDADKSIEGARAGNLLAAASAACRAILLDPTKPSPQRSLLATVASPLTTASGRSKLLWQFLDEKAQEEFAKTTVSQCKSALDKLEKAANATGDAKASVATTIAFLRMYAKPVADVEDGLKVAGSAAEFSKSTKYLPLYLKAYFMHLKNDAEGAGKALDAAEKAADLTDSARNDIRELRKLIEEKKT